MSAATPRPVRRVAAALGLLVLALPAWAAPAPASPLRPRPIAYTERVLPNGLQFIAVPSNTSPTVSVQVWYHVGAKDDPPGRSGFAHLFEHLMFKGTKNLKAEQFDRLTEDIGGENNASTGNDVTEYHETVPSNHLEVLLWAEAERMANLDVDEANFKSERAVVEEEFRQRVLASPYGRLLSTGLSQASYLSHPYKRPPIGSIADLEAASLADVTAFHRTYYRPDNATLVVAGDFDPKQLDAWVDRYFARVPRPDAPIPRVDATEPRWTADRFVALTGPNVPLPAVAVVWQAPPADSADAPALQIAAALLGAGESSRLNQSLVYTQQIATQVGFDPDLRDGPSLLVGYAIAAGGKPLPELRNGLLNQIRGMAAAPIGAAELAKVKTQVLTGALRTRETPGGLATAIGDAAVLQHDSSKVNEDLVALQQVTAEDVKRVLQRYVVDAPVLTIVYTQEGAAR